MNTGWLRLSKYRVINMGRANGVVFNDKSDAATVFYGSHDTTTITDPAELAVLRGWLKDVDQRDVLAALRRLQDIAHIVVNHFDEVENTVCVSSATWFVNQARAALACGANALGEAVATS